MEINQKITSDEFIKSNLVILKGDRKDGKGTYETVAIAKNSMWNSSIVAIADMFGAKTIDNRKSK